jgi:epoxyqueuosine reductase
VRHGVERDHDAPPDRLLARAVLREETEARGFTRFGVARAQTPPGFEAFERWLDAGLHADMRYLAETREVRRSPESLLPGARSVVCLAAPHGAGAWSAADGSTLARYARGDDYHGTLRTRALAAAEAARRRLGGAWTYRVCVDSTPIAERSFAAAAGLGWIGKNGCLIDAEQGSYLLLAEILTDLDLPADAPAAERCGSCVRCLDACPTGAFAAPGVVDARRCIAYWTIEHRGPLPDSWKDAIGGHVFGCDVCQEVCPWNAPRQRAEAGAGWSPAPGRAEILAMGKGEWRRRFGATALNRASRRGLQRNAAASAGGGRDASCRDALASAAGVAERGLADAARWALERLDPSPSL